MAGLTIKRRLFISNILMLILPVLLTFAVIASIFFILMSVTGIDDIRTLGYGNLFDNVIEDVDTLTRSWSQDDGLEKIEAEIDKFNNQYHSGGVKLYLYKGSELIYPRLGVNSAVPDMALSYDGEYVLVADNTAVYRVNTDEYTVILLDESYTRYNREDAAKNGLYPGIVMFVLLIAVIFFTNWTLTRFVFRSIMTPVDTLVNGVYEIRDGNLNYRIEYNKKDEFAGVCSDFNEMAGRLSDMVTARQKDETSRRELIAGISHDLRTPLTSIKAYIEGLEKGVASTPELRKRYLGTIKSKTEDLEYIINQLFLFSKLDIGEFPFRPERVDIGSELSSLISGHIKEYGEKGLTVTLTQNIQNVYVEIDVIQFRNVIYNILENSMKYKNKENAETKIECTKKNKDIIITLRDNGPGVPEEAADKLFDIFYRGDLSRKNPSKGSGLGLAISKKIIERLGGKIHAENIDGGGLAVIIELPAKN